MLNIRLKELRKRKKITQEELAKIIGVERSSVGKYESPTKPVIPSSEIVNKIADYFKVSTDYLFGREDITPNDFDTSGFNQPVWRHILEANSYNVASAYKAYLEFEEAEREDAMRPLDEQLSGIEFALYSEVKDLTENQKQDILDYVKFKKSQWDKNNDK